MYKGVVLELGSLSSTQISTVSYSCWKFSKKVSLTCTITVTLCVHVLVNLDETTPGNSDVHHMLLVLYESLLQLNV